MTTALPAVWPTVVHMLDAAARHRPEAVALVCDDDALSYRAYAACVSALAHELQAAGIGAGERVALLMGNSIAIAIATFGVQAAGAQVVPLNPAYTASELAPMLDDAAPALIIFDGSIAPTVRPLIDRPGGRSIEVGADGRRLTAARDRLELADRLPLPDPDALSTLQYTGGTTGRSKGVELTHRAVAVNVSQREALLPTEPDDERVLAVTPLFHVYAVSMGLYLAAYCRATLVIVARYRPDTVLEAIARHRISLLGGSPTILAGLLACDAFGSTDLGSLRLCFSGSSALPEATLRRWEAATGCPVAEGYGQSEAGPVLAFNPRDGVRKIGSVGIAVPCTDLEIVDIESGDGPLPVGSAGEIRARGPQVMRGYRNLPDETAAALRDGWLYTGDIGELDGDGYLTIRGRKKEMVIVGGYNVYPREVEEALCTHPRVREAAVVGVPDAYRGEALVAAVVVDGAADGSVAELLAHLAERLVAYKVPRDLRLVDALPKTSVGKVDKSRLRDEVLRAKA
jgi:long-chain acyl-CoA synthetase